MRFIVAGTLLSFGALISTAAHAQQVKSLSYAEAAAFEKWLQGNEYSPLREELVYTQPVNKKVACKLPSSSDQLSRNNFRAYWDGQCKNGYAFGLGRDIAISDTHHVEEITIHDGTGQSKVNTPSVVYDYVNKQVVYSIVGEYFPSKRVFSESIQNSMNGFNVVYEAGKVEASGKQFFIQFSPFSPFRTFLNIERQVTYKFTEHTMPAIVDPSSATFAAELINSTTRIPGGVAFVRYGNDQVKHFQVDGAQKTQVTLPTEYVLHLNEKLTAAAQNTANIDVERARQIEREYLHLACNGKYTINGLDKAVSTKICTWRDEFKVPYQSALTKYNTELAQMKLKAEVAQQQRQFQQQQWATAQQINAQQAAAQAQLAAQQEALNRQQSHLAMQETVNALDQMGQQMRNAGQQMLQSVQRQPTPQFVPFTPFGGSNRVNCLHIGSMTSCR